MQNMTEIEKKFHKVDGKDVVLFNDKGVKYRRRVKMIDGKPTFKIDGFKYAYDNNTKTLIAVEDEVKTTTSKVTPVEQSKFGINVRFGFLEKFATMVLDGKLASLLVTGEGGLGKTFTIKAQLAAANLEEGLDFVIVKGYSTPKALYATLYENRDKMVIFDDCDSVLKDPISLNLLKGALDSYDKRTISWLSRGFIQDDLPSSFDFEGQVIFISNLKLAKVDGAVRSRTLSVDLSMTLDDKIARMRAILTNILPEYDDALKTEVLEILDDKKEEAKELNMRTFEKAIKIFDAYGGTSEGHDAIDYMLTNA